MRIRPATEADIPALFDVRTSVRQNHLFLEQMAGLGITPQSVAEMLRTSMRAWVGEADGVVVFAMASAADGSVFAMFVRPSHEGRGFGRRLMEQAEAWLFSLGFGEIWLRTDPDPAVRANGFYRRLGWSGVGVQEDGQIQYVKPRPADPSERPT